MIIFANLYARLHLETFGIDLTKKDIRPAIQYAVHHDEGTPHIHLVVVPLKDGKLNARHFIGGHRDRMKELQDDFYEKVGKKFGLDRGISKEMTKAEHSRPTLKHKAAELDMREEALIEREEILEARTKAVANFTMDFTKLIGMKPHDVCELKTLVSNWDKATPTGLRVIAEDIEQSGAKTVGEYRQLRETQRQKELQARR